MSEFVEMVHYGDFWGRFDLHVPVCVQEAVMTLAKGGTLEGGAPAAVVRPLLDLLVCSCSSHHFV